MVEDASDTATARLSSGAARVIVIYDDSGTELANRFSADRALTSLVLVYLCVLVIRESVLANPLGYLLLILIALWAVAYEGPYGLVATDHKPSLIHSPATGTLRRALDGLHPRPTPFLSAPLVPLPLRQEITQALTAGDNGRCGRGIWRLLYGRLRLALGLPGLCGHETEPGPVSRPLGLHRVLRLGRGSATEGRWPAEP